jgi:hypothetical protein
MCKVDTLTIDSITAINLSTNPKVALPENTTLVLNDNTHQKNDQKIQKTSSYLFPNPYLQNTTEPNNQHWF